MKTALTARTDAVHAVSASIHFSDRGDVLDNTVDYRNDCQSIL